jgi:hypothetical protein
MALGPFCLVASLNGKRPVGYCQRSRGNDANRACQKEHALDHSPSLVAGHTSLTCCANRLCASVQLESLTGASRPLLRSVTAGILTSL